jgi:hypothetical protein
MTVTDVDSGPFERVLGDTSELRTLEKLLAMPSFEFSVSELSVMTDLSRLSIYRVIRNFEAWKVVSALDRGKRKRYKLNSESGLVSAFYAFNHELALTLAGDETAFAIETETIAPNLEPAFAYRRRASALKSATGEFTRIAAEMRKDRPFGALA